MKILLALLLLLVPVAADATAPTRGYVARACGFDADDDGIIGEASDCNWCDGVTTDPDGDGVVEDQIYVNCGTGNNTTTCGTPGSPCATIRYGITRAGAVTGGAENIVCFTGTCTAEGTNIPLMTGGTGNHTRALTGSLVTSSFQYSNNPSMIVGWDVDNDRSYPPFDTNDVSVLDGGPGQTLRAFNMGTSVDDFEMAHFSATRYADFDSIGLAAADAAIVAGSSMGFVGLSTNTNTTDSERLYFHDLDMSYILRRMARVNESRIFNAFVSVSTRQLNWLAIENVRCLDCGGYFIRGSGGDTVINGPIRIAGNTMRGLPCSNNDTLCDHVVGSNTVANQSSINFSKLFGWWDDLEIVDNDIDANVANYTPHVDSSNLCGNLDSCLKNVYYINNKCTNPRFLLQIQPSSDSCSTRDLGPLYIRQNEAIWTSAASVYDSDKTGIQVLPSNVNNLKLGNVEISNNTFTAMAGSGGVGQWLELRSGHPAACADLAGIMSILNNTFYGNCTRGSVGCITFGANVTTCPYRHYVVKNNILAGIQAGGRPNVWVDANVTSTIDLDMNYNLYDPEVQWAWGDTVRTTIAAWRTASSEDANSIHGCSPGEPSFVSTVTGDVHLAASDTCARNRGVNLGATLDYDRDDDSRPLGGGYEIGSDEITGAAACTVNADCNDTNGCTTDTCSGGNCVFTNNTASCDDGLFCTLTDTCVNGSCVGLGTPCSGGTPVCNETTNACEATATTTTITTTTTLSPEGFIGQMALAVDFQGEVAGENAADDSRFLNHLGETVVGALGTIARGTASGWMGTYATIDDGDASTGESFTRAHASVGGLPGGTGVTFGCAIKPTGTDTTRGYGFLGKRSGLAGFRLAWWADCDSGTGGNQACVKGQLGDGATTSTITSANSSAPVSTWTAAAIVSQQSVADGAYAVINGAVSGATATVAGIGANTTPLYVGDPDVAFDYEGSIDSCWVIPSGVSTATVAHLQMCDANGAACACNAGTPTAFKTCANNGDCGGSAICDHADSLQCRGHWVTGWTTSRPACNLNSLVYTPTTTTLPVTTTTNTTTTTVAATTTTSVPQVGANCRGCTCASCSF